MSPAFSLQARMIVQLNGENFLGPGRIELLEKIKSTGSISEASRLMGMSYRKALHVIDRMNQVYGHDLVQTWKGGAEKGGAKITEMGEILIARYQEVCLKIHRLLTLEEPHFNP
ncbi:MAG: LysR family transcriptional regulator [Saprospiraceae bacterium]|nr:LysR family transcriptional regulator [Saprospiraceae bacterium]